MKVTIDKALLEQVHRALQTEQEIYCENDPEDGAPEYLNEAVRYLQAALAEPAVEQAEKLDPLTQLQVAYVMGLRDANSAPQPAPVQEPVTWNQVQVCTWIGNQLMTQPSMFERNAVCKFVRSLGRNEKLAKYFPAPMAAQPRKAVNLTGEEVGMLTVFDGLHHVETPVLVGFIRHIEAALRQKAGL